jgi:molybdopterin molybdotransferase
MTEFETRKADWLGVGEAVIRTLEAASPLDPETVPLHDAWGRALAEAVEAGATLPPWDNSAMDGYAVHAIDLDGASKEKPVSLTVVGDIPAGGRASRRLGQGEAVRIMTGAPMPPGADTVVRVEDTDAEAISGTVLVFSSQDLGRNIRPGGQDMVAGDEVLAPGTSLASGQIGVLAAAGRRVVQVRRRPRVAILSNGDELADASEFDRVRAGEAIPETNGTTLAAAVAASGGVPLELGIAEDTEASILERIESARDLEADVLLTSGGASMGERDLFKRVLSKMGFRLDFWRVRIRPGTPFSFGAIPAKGPGRPLYVFGLPGNPASSFVTFQVFARPFLLALAGHRRIHRPVVVVETTSLLESPAHLTHFFRVRLEGSPWPTRAHLSGLQGSGLVLGQGRAHGLGVVPEGVTHVNPGERINVILLDELGLGGEEPGYLEV